MPNPTNRLTVVIIGKGTVGSEIERQMKMKNIDDIITIDIDPETHADCNSLESLWNYKQHIDVYILTVWDVETVLMVCKKIGRRHSDTPLVSIETTIVPGTYQKIKKIMPEMKLVIFQERIYPNDEFHGVFNQPRVMGGDWKEGREFYLRYMIYENIVVTDNIEMAELSHLVDNSFRYIQIAVAEELAMLVGQENFPELRRLCNTKWNVNIPEAREGIGGHCLPKDIKLFNDHYSGNAFFKLAESCNETYKKWVKKL